MSNPFPPSELILNPDGSVYHLNLKSGEIANKIITVGDQERVDKVALHFDEIYLTKSKREFKTITGRIGKTDLTVISTGIGTDNIDIVFSELDALVNIDLETRLPKEKHTKLEFYRVGTSGSIREEVLVGDTILSRAAIGLDGLMHYYRYEESPMEQVLSTKARAQIANELPKVFPYACEGSSLLLDKLKDFGQEGITVTATGFYGPQGRSLLARPRDSNFLDAIASIAIGNVRCTNLEMETAGIYGMAKILGHEAISINIILANRATQIFHQKPKEVVANRIKDFLLTIS